MYLCEHVYKVFGPLPSGDCKNIKSSFSEKEAKIKAPTLSFRYIVPLADIKAISLYYKNRGVPPPPNSELKITS